MFANVRNCGKRERLCKSPHSWQMADWMNERGEMAGDVEQKILERVTCILCIVDGGNILGRMRAE